MQKSFNIEEYTKRIQEEDRIHTEENIARFKADDYILDCIKDTYRRDLKHLEVDDDGFITMSKTDIMCYMNSTTEDNYETDDKRNEKLPFKELCEIFADHLGLPLGWKIIKTNDTVAYRKLLEEIKQCAQHMLQIKRFDEVYADINILVYEMEPEYDEM